MAGQLIATPWVRDALPAEERHELALRLPAGSRLELHARSPRGPFLAMATGGIRLWRPTVRGAAEAAIAELGAATR